MAGIIVDINAKNAGLRGAVRESISEIRHLTEELRRLREQANPPGADGANGGGIFGAMLGAGLVTGALSKAGSFVLSTVQELIQNVGELVDISDQLGIPAEQIQRLQDAFMGAGVEAKDLRKALTTLNTTRQAAIGGDEKAIHTLAQLGVAMGDLTGIPLEDLLYRVAEGLAATTDKGVALQLQMDAMGSKSAKLYSTMAGGAKSVQDAMAATSDALTETQMRKIDELDDKWAQLKARVGRKAMGAVLQTAETWDFLRARGLRFPWEDDETAAPAPVPAAPPGAPSPAAAGQQDTARDAALAEARRNRALADAEAAKQAIEDEKLHKDAVEDVNKSMKERVDILRDAVGFQGRYTRSVFELMAAYAKWKNTEPENRLGKAQAAAEYAAASAKFEKTRADQVKRFGMTRHDREAAERKDRDDERAQRKGERIYTDRERDRVDRDFRNHRINATQRDAMLKELRLTKDGKVQGSPEQQAADTLKQILDIIDPVAGKIKRAQ